MMQTSIRLAAALAAATLAASVVAIAAAHAAEKPAPKMSVEERVKTQCAACHGTDGNGVEAFKDYPRLAGQYADFLYKALRDYQSDARKNPIMGAQAKMLDKSELRPLAEYFARQQGHLSVVR